LSLAGLAATYSPRA